MKVICLRMGLGKGTVSLALGGQWRGLTINQWPKLRILDKVNDEEVNETQLGYAPGTSDQSHSYEKDIQPTIPHTPD